MKGTYRFNEDGAIIIETKLSGAIFPNVSEAVKYCRENNIQAYPA